MVEAALRRADALSPTARLLWAASRVVADLDEVAAAIDDGADPELAAGGAAVNRVAPLVWRSVDAADRTAWLGSAGDALRREFELRRVQAEVLLPFALATAIEPLRAAGLEPVVFKGPSLAARYPAPGLRPMDDIDVLLRADQHDRACAALTHAGWTVCDRPGNHYDTLLLHPRVPDLPLELHRGLESWVQRTTDLTVERLWEARVPVDLFGVATFGLPPEVEIVALAAHAGKPFHNFERLIWSVDLAVVAADAGDRLDWERVGRVARDVGAATVVAVGLHHARRLGAAVPDELVTLPAGRFRTAAVAPLIEETFPLRQLDERSVHRLRYALRDRRRRQAQLYIGEIGACSPLRRPVCAAETLAWWVREWWAWRRTGAVRGPKEPKPS